MTTRSVPEFLVPGGALRGPMMGELLDRLGGLRELHNGDRIGPWRISHEIGRGGMAIVYQAERADDEFEQTVALKWLRPDSEGAMAQSLFRRERQILAALEHPNIARLLDGGHTEDDILWFAMEYIDGERIDRFCVEQSLSEDARLALFIETCGAVQFAHGRALIHRDIKPANVLVTPSGRPILLDFGIAQLCNVEEDPLAARAHTPGFASPEQERGLPLSTASDIYQLGRLLDDMLGRGRPRARDLSAIIDKARAEAPMARYPTVAALIEDVAHFRQRRPVHARRGGLRYRGLRFVQRNRLGVAIGFATCVLFVGLLAWFLSRIANERNTAQHEAARAAASIDFLTDLFKVSDPASNRGNTLTANQILESGTAKVTTTLKDQPELRAEMLHTIGKVHMNLGQFARAEPLLRESLAISREHAGVAVEDVALRWRALAQVQWRMGHYADALASSRAGYALIERLDGQTELAGKLLNTQAVCEFLLGHFERAAAIERRAIKRIETELGTQHELAGFAYNNLARALGELDRQDEALLALQKAAANVRARLGADDTDTHLVAASYARQLARVGRYAEAAPILARSEEGLQLRLGARDTRYAYVLTADAEARIGAGDGANALILADAALDIYRSHTDADPAELARTVEMRGLALAALGRPDQALDAFRESLAIRQTQLSDDHIDIATSRFLVGRQLCALGDARRGLELLDQALRIQQSALPASHSGLKATRDSIAGCGKS